MKETGYGEAMTALLVELSASLTEQKIASVEQTTVRPLKVINTTILVNQTLCLCKNQYNSDNNNNRNNKLSKAYMLQFISSTSLSSLGDSSLDVEGGGLKKVIIFNSI